MIKNYVTYIPSESEMALRARIIKILNGVCYTTLLTTISVRSTKYMHNFNMQFGLKENGVGIHKSLHQLYDCFITKLT